MYIICKYGVICFDVSEHMSRRYEQIKKMAPKRKWEIFPGKNKFYLNGRVIMAKANGVCLFTAVLILATSALFFAFEYVSKLRINYIFLIIKNTHMLGRVQTFHHFFL